MLSTLWGNNLDAEASDVSRPELSPRVCACFMSTGRSSGSKLTAGPRGYGQAALQRLQIWMTLWWCLLLSIYDRRTLVNCQEFVLSMEAIDGDGDDDGDDADHYY